MTSSHPMSETDLQAYADKAATRQRCAECVALWRPGWESVSGAMMMAHLEPVGVLSTETTWDRLDEFHPERTNLWSPAAPIALGWYPYNRCTLWRCKGCSAAFLRYTEYGGYYEDERTRPLLADLIVTPEIGPS